MSNHTTILNYITHPNSPAHKTCPTDSEAITKNLTIYKSKYLDYLTCVFHIVVSTIHAHAHIWNKMWPYCIMDIITL